MGFEPMNPCRLAVFKTAAIVRSATPPRPGIVSENGWLDQSIGRCHQDKEVGRVHEYPVRLTLQSQRQFWLDYDQLLRYNRKVYIAYMNGMTAL